MLRKLLPAAAALWLIPTLALAQDATAPSPAPPATTAPPTPAAPPPAPSTTAPPTPATPAESSQPPAAPAGTVSLRLKYKVGEVLKYHYTTSVTGSFEMMGRQLPMNTETSGDLTETVKQVDANGNATVLGQTSGLTMTMNGHQQAMPAMSADQLTKGFSSVVSPTGKIVSIDTSGIKAPTKMPGLDVSNLLGGFNQGTFSLLPEQPVKANDVWRGKIALASLSMAIYVKNVLLGLSQSGGHNIADIGTKYAGNFGPAPVPGMQMSGTMTGTGRNKFDVDAGYLTNTTTVIAMDMKMKMKIPSAMASSGSTSMSFHMTILANQDLVSAQ